MKFKRTILSVSTAVLLWLSFPYYELRFLAWFAFVPLFFMLDTAPRRSALAYSYAAGFLFFLLLLSWLRHVTVAGLLVLSFYLAFYFVFFAYAFVLCRQRSAQNRTEFKFIIFLSSVWVILEYCRSFLLSGFPWALLGYSQYRNLAFIQFADITGVWGVSFVVMAVNLCCFFALQAFLRKEKDSLRRCIAALAIIFFAAHAYGSYALKKYSAKKDSPELMLSLAQGNVAQDEKWESMFASRIKENYASLSRQAAAGNPDLLVWPETSYPDYVVDGDSNTFDELYEIVHANGVPLLFGAIMQAQEFDTYFNAAILLLPFNDSRTLYKKIHLVPFGEYIPLRRYLPFLEEIIPIADFRAGEKYTLFSVENKSGRLFRFGVLICFEDTLFALARQFRLRGADFLVNITNDAWFKQSASPYQHLQASVFRAVENRMCVARAANTGISCMIDDSGKIYNRLQDAGGKDIFVRGFLSGKIKAPIAESVYTRWGDWFVIACGACALTFLIYLRKKI